MDSFEALRAYLHSVPEVTLAYLFGSQADDTAGPLSDYDVGVLVQSPSPELRYRLSREIGRVLGAKRIDLVLLNRAAVELAYAVIAQGQLLYRRSLAEQVEFEARILSLYGDYLPVLRQQRQDILEGRHRETGVQRYREALGRTGRTLAALGATQSEATS